MGGFDIDLMCCMPEAVDDMVAFIAGLNGIDEDHIGFFDTAAADIARSCASSRCRSRKASGLQSTTGRSSAFWGSRPIPKSGAVWIYGPPVRHPLWQAVADQLYATALPAVPSGIGQQQLFCDGRVVTAGTLGAARLRAAQPIGHHDAEPCRP